MPIPAHVDTLIHARWVIPVNEMDDIFENNTLVVDKGNIVDCLPNADCNGKYQADENYHLTEHVLIPGLINSHGHSPMSLLRGYADDLPLMAWLQEHIWPAEQQWVNEDFVHDGTALAIAEMLSTGTTTFSDMYFFPNITAQVANHHHMRVQICAPVLDFPTAWAQDADDYINKALKIHDDYRNNDLVYLNFGPHAPYTVADAPLQRIATLASELNTYVQIHVHETASEVEESIQKFNKRPLSRLNDLGLLSPNLQCVHMTQIDAEDMELLQTYKPHIIHCPASNLKLGSGHCPVQQLQDKHINVAIGTDGAASNNGLNILNESRLAALLSKGINQDPSSLKAFDALKMITINAAKAIGLEEQIGSLETGKWADVTAVDLSTADCQPVHHPLSQLIYANAGNHISHVWVNGKVLLNDTQFVHLDYQAVKAKARQWQEKMIQNGQY